MQYCKGKIIIRNKINRWAETCAKSAITFCADPDQVPAHWQLSKRASEESSSIASKLVKLQYGISVTLLGSLLGTLKIDQIIRDHLKNTFHHFIELERNYSLFLLNCSFEEQIY